MKKILFVNSSLDSGGSERVMSIIANYFAKNSEYECHMVLLRGDKKKVYETSENLKLIEFHYKSKNKIHIVLSRFIQFRKLLKNIRPDIIVSFMWDINMFTLISCIGFKSKVIISERCHPKMGNQSILRKIGQRWLYNLADVIVLQTEYVKQFYSNRIQKKSVVIANPIDSTNLPIIDFNKCENIICAAGRFTKQKRFDLLIDAFKDVSITKNDYKLVIYGDGELREEYLKQIDNLGIEDKVLLPGYVENINELMSNCKIYVSSSDFEGISNSMLEALAMGIPSVCTDCPVGGAKMIIVDGKNGLLVPVGDRKSITNAIRRLIEDEDLYNNISKEAIKVRESYSVSIIGKKWETLFYEGIEVI